MKTLLAASLLGNIAVFGLLYVAGSNLQRSSERHTEFIGKLSLWESKNGCLGPELDDYFWLGGCQFGDARKQSYRATSCQVTTAFVWCVP